MLPWSRPTAGVLVSGFILALSASAQGQAPRDVPAQHWAASSVQAVVSRGVMAAPKGTFGGEKKVTRRELAVILYNFARSLEQQKWPRGASKPVTHKTRGASPGSGAVTRYELAAVLDRVARQVMVGLPKPTGKVYGETEALPKGFMRRIPKSEPAYAAIAYLANNRMAWDDSVVLKPGNQPVTGQEAARAVAIMIAGLNDRLTDEPQNREDIGEPPPRERP
jgi:hypothetical protein